MNVSLGMGDSGNAHHAIDIFIRLPYGDNILRLSISILLFCFCNYIYYTIKFHLSHSNPQKRQVPPTVPYLLPLIGSALSFAFDGVNFIKKATRYRGDLVPVKLSVLASDIYLIQGSKEVEAVWKELLLGSPIFIYTFALQNVFGMPKHALPVYRADDSGSHRRPHPLSNVEPHNRVDFLTHMALLKAFGGSGLAKSFERCAILLKRNLESMNIPEDEWVEMPSLRDFFQTQMGSAVLEGQYGPSLLKLSPSFLDDLWAFDKSMPYFAKLFPQILIPKAYRVRAQLIDSIRQWHKYCREHFKESDIGPDGDSDPYWGSELMRTRQKVLLSIDNQDQESLVSTDLGLIWASVTNVVPSTMMCAYHIFRRPDLNKRLQNSLEGTANDSVLGIEMDKILQEPLLSSVYAETLRLHVQAFVTRTSPHTGVEIGHWHIPKNKVCMVNTYASHMDESFWNTRQGVHPVDSFWPERFMIDPADPASGPVRSDVAEDIYKRPNSDEKNGSSPFFSLEGLRGAWIPFGGGFSACPGRHFAKRIIFYALGLLITSYEIKIITEELEMSSATFGFGTQKPKHDIRFLIRRRGNRSLSRSAC